jgi:histidinol-phosphate aminotransferase
MISSEDVMDLVRAPLHEYQRYVRGTSVEEARRRYGLSEVVKLSQNENPFGTSAKALAALRAVPSFSEYVEDDYLALRTKLADRYGLGPENVLLGHGSNEIVAALFTTFVEKGDEVVMAVPSFSLYAKYTRIAAAIPVEVPLQEGVHDLAAMLAAVTPQTKLVFVCDPNNPTGTRVEREDLIDFAAALPESAILVVDAAYFEYADARALDAVDLIASRPRTVVLRTASKIYGMAALRFGYAYSSAAIVDWMLRVQLPFNVSLPALAAVGAALDDREFVERSIASNERGKARFSAAFERLGVFAYPTAANFVTVRVPVAAAAAYEALMRRGIVVRSGDGLRLPHFLRVTVGTAEQNEAFLAAFGAELPGWRAAAGEPAP